MDKIGVNTLPVAMAAIFVSLAIATCLDLKGRNNTIANQGAAFKKTSASHNNNAHGTWIERAISVGNIAWRTRLKIFFSFLIFIADLIKHKGWYKFTRVE